MATIKGKTVPVEAIMEVIVALVEMAKKLADRAHQVGALTDAQRIAIHDHADSIFSIYENAAPPPKQGK